MEDERKINMKKSYIWSLPTRAFHLLFALFILLAFLTDDDKLLNYHAIIGYSILILLVFRVCWGYFGPKYSLFKDFPANKNEAKEFLKNIFDILIPVKFLTCPQSRIIFFTNIDFILASDNRISATTLIREHFYPCQNLFQ